MESNQEWLWRQDYEKAYYFNCCDFNLCSYVFLLKRPWKNDFKKESLYRMRKTKAH